MSHPTFSSEVLSPTVLAALTPRFTIEREIGAGGMATVFLARDERYDRPVALKVLRRNSDLAAGVERFEREIKLLARLQHPLILPLHDSGIAGDTLYFVMPYVDGETLRDRLAKDGPLPIAEAVRLATEVADALAYAHAQGVVHRDIKPENIMLWRGHAVVADFGIAGLVQAASVESSSSQRLTQAGFSLGTPAYMSPEQAAGELDIGPPADQYSLGVVLYEMLTGGPPFYGSTYSVLARHLTEKPDPARTLRADIPPAVSEAIDQALAKKRESRWPSIGAFRDALHTGTTPSTPLTAAAAAVDTRISIAVLPFANVGGAPENEFFSDGLTEELIGALARLPRLRVVSRTSAFSFRGRDVPLAEIGSQLRVGFVLTGSVRRSGDRLRLLAQLSRVADDTLLWSEIYERRLADVFDVQDELTRRIVGTVREALGTGDTTTPAPICQACSVTAYDQYLQGRHHWNKRGVPSLRAGLACFQRAIEADPNFAQAYAGLADSYALLASSGEPEPSQLFASARTAALKSISLDPQLAEGYASLGFVKLHHDWDMDAAGHDLRRATELNPSYATAWQWYAAYLRAVARFDEAIAASEHALSLDPFAVGTSVGLGISHFFARDMETAAAHFQRAIAMEPDSLDPYTWLASAYHEMKRYDEAVKMTERAILLMPNEFGRIGMQAVLHARMGRPDEARAFLDQLTVLPSAPPFFVALIYSLLGEKDEVYRWLNRGVDERAPFMYWMRTYPLLSAEWSDPRFAAVLERMRLGPPLTVDRG